MRQQAEEEGGDGRGGDLISFTQIPQDTFNEMPADIQREIMYSLRETRGPKRRRQQQQRQRGAAAGSPSRAPRPAAPAAMLTRLDIDLDVLSELPPDVRAEVERAYGLG